MVDDAPPSFLMDSNVSPNWKTKKTQGVEARSLARKEIRVIPDF